MCPSALRKNDKGYCALDIGLDIIAIHLVHYSKLG